MDAASYQQYLQETGDWLKSARTRLLAHLIERHRPRIEQLESIEVGAGAGQNLPTLARFGTVDAIEVNPLGRDAIRSRNIARDVFAEPVPFALDRRYDVACALDVVEHLEDDVGALQWMARLLRPGGVLVVTVPAYQWLFSDHDRALQHYRRYTRARLLAALPKELEPVTSGYFTHFAFPLALAARTAWALRRRLRPGAPAKQSSPRGGLATTLLGGLHAAELGLIARGYQPPFGLSVYLVARRVGAA